jgi:DNA primase
MAIFSKESLETLRARVDLVDVLTPHVEFKKTGAAYKALCPFHDEKSPSFTIQKGDTHYHCFGCGAHGDAIQFLMTYVKLSFNDAVESLAERFHVTLEKTEKTDEPKGPPKQKIKEALLEASRYYHFNLLHTPEGHVVLKYLLKRGVTQEFIHHFMIGLAPVFNGYLTKFMHAKDIHDEILVAAGLLTAGKDGRFRDFFLDRITFPIQDAAGAVIGFSARKYKEETYGGKYINTAETVLFKKSRVLFGLNFSRRRIAKLRKVLVVEGQIDALRLIQEGFNITVAGQGTAFGEGHVKELLTLGVNVVYLCLDSDNAGLEATSKIGDLFQKQGVEVRVIQLPNGMDPDSYLQQYEPFDFLKLMDDSLDYLSFQVKYQGRNLNVDSPAGKSELIGMIAKQIRTWEHPVMVQESLRQLASLTQVREEMVGAMQDHIPNVYLKPTASVGLQTIDTDQILETDFLRWLHLMGDQNPNFVLLARNNLPVNLLRSPVCRLIYATYLKNQEMNLPLDLVSLMIQIDSTEAQSLLSQLTAKKVNKERAEKHYIETIQAILDRNWILQREEIKMKIQSGQCSDEEALSLALAFNNLKRRKDVSLP